MKGAEVGEGAVEFCPQSRFHFVVVMLRYVIPVRYELNLAFIL
jgi:hypothetical protein